MGSVGGSRNVLEPTSAQEQTLKDIARRTANLKNEQYSIVDRDGNIVATSKGEKHQVSLTVGEKRKYMDNAISIHNHPDGGTFSDADLRDFGFGASEIRIAAPEGTYILRNTKMGTPEQTAGWHAMQEELQKQPFTQERGFSELRELAKATPTVKKLNDEMKALSEKWLKARDNGASTEALEEYNKQYDKIAAEYKKALNKAQRDIVVNPYHDWYTQNAKKYGFEYEFIEKRRR